MLFVDLLSLHLVTFLMFFILVAILLAVMFVCASSERGFSTYICL